MEPEKIQFSHYRALKLIGKGGIGEVYLADDAQAKRQVAAKIISIEVLKAKQEANMNTLRLFLREVDASAKLNHPNILLVGDHGEATIDKLPIAYVVMPYRPEGSLSTWLSQHAQKQANWRPTPRQVVHIIRQTGAALQHAHDHKIMHLDVKPSNLLIHNRSTVDEYPDLLLSDFGSASLISATQIRTTSAYLAPEQWNNQPVFASDQYALGTLAYELLTGSPPFQTARQNGADAPVQERPKSVRDFIPQLAPDVDAVLQRALAKKSEERFPSVAAFTQAFQAALQSVTASGEHLQPSNPPTPAPQAPTKPESNGDIRTTLGISAQEAREGAVRTLSLPDGQKVEVQIPAGAQDDQVITLNGKGEVPAPGAPAGNLYLRLSLPKIPAVASSARNNAASPMPEAATARPATPAPPMSHAPAPVTPLPATPRPGAPSQGTTSGSPAPMNTPPMPPAPLTPLPATPRPNVAQGPASIAPLSPATPRPNVGQGPASIAPLPPSPMGPPRPNMSQGPASIAPLPPAPMGPPRPNASQGPASIAPLPPTPPASPRPNVGQGPASIAPMPPSPMGPPRSNMSQGPASIAPMPPSPMPPARPNGSQGPVSNVPPSPMPRSNMSQGPASIAPLPPEQNAFARRKPDMSPAAPAAPLPRRANSPAAVIVMILLLLIALGVGGYGALTSNWALLQNILYGTPAPTVPGTYNQITPTTTGKTTSSPWHTQVSGTQQELVSVAWADTRFATVGSNGTILTSPDGVTWTSRHSGTTQFLWSVTWSGSLLTAVGTGGTILTSPDGTTWTVQHSGTTQDLWSVNWVDGSLFVAVGTNGTILTSKDGHTWAAQQSNSGQILDGVGWSGSVLAVVGTNGLILTSTDDGTTWTIQTSGTQQLLESVNWVNNQFIAVGTNGTILTSTKGTVWTLQNSNVTQNLSGAGWSGSQYVIVGDNGTILTSAKGTTWTVQPSGTSQRLLSIAISTTTFAISSLTPIPTIPTFVAVGNHGAILTRS